MICFIFINLVNYTNVVAVEVTDCEGNLIKAREENCRRGVGWNNRFTEDFLDSVVGTIIYPDSFARYGSQARGTYEIQGYSSGLCTIRIYEYDHTTNKTEIYRRLLDDITDGCEIELWYVGGGKIEVIVNNNTTRKQAQPSDEVQHRSREIPRARSYINLAQEGGGVERSFSKIRETLILGRPEDWDHTNYRLEETQIPTDTAPVEVYRGSNKHRRCTIL